MRFIEKVASTIGAYVGYRGAPLYDSEKQELVLLVESMYKDQQLEPDTDIEELITQAEKTIKVVMESDMNYAS